MRDVLLSAASSCYSLGRVKAPDLKGQRGTVEWRTYSPAKRPDLIVLDGAARGGHLLGDVYVPSVSVPSHSAWIGGGAVDFMRRAEAEKVKEYGEILVQHEVMPLVVGDCGAFGPRLVNFIETLHAISCGKSDTPSWSARHFKQILVQELSVVFWRSLGDYMGAYLAK